nr:hypothetical protein GCM10020093_053710 [Planobispora longispora]
MAQLQAAARIRQLNPGRRLRELEELERLAAEWRGRHAEPMIVLTRTEGPDMVTQARTEESKESFDAVRGALDAYNAAWSRQREAARADLTAARVTRDTVFIVIIGALLLAVVAMAVLLRLVVFRPLDRLSAASRRVTGGDFSHHVDTGGPADLAELARDMEAMRGRIVAELEETRRSQRLLAERAEELKRSNTELEQFAYVASHDLQEPLRKVASFTQMLEQRYADQLDDRARQYIAFAVDGAKRMQELINELLTFSRVGRITRDPVTFGLGDVVAAALRNLSAAIEDAGAEVEVGDLPVISGDRSQFVMLWQNLIGNAVKFRHPDRAPVIRIEAWREGRSGASRWPTTASASTPGSPKRSSSSSSGCTPGTPTRARGSASRSAGRSSNITTAGSGSTPITPAVPASSSPCPPRTSRRPAASPSRSPRGGRERARHVRSFPSVPAIR